MQNQINYLAAILSAGLLQKTNADIDLTKADWKTIVAFLRTNRLTVIARSGLALYKEQGLPIPDQKVWMKIHGDAVSAEITSLSMAAAVMRLSQQWVKEGKRPLALGGLAFADCYPMPNLHYSTELECLPLYKEGGMKDGGEAAQFKEGKLSVSVVDSLAGRFGSVQCDHQEAVLRQAFSVGHCTLHPAYQVAYPNLNFRALYLAFTAQQELLQGKLSFGKVIDWAMVLRCIGQSAPEAFDAALFLQQVEDLGLLAFTQSITALAVRLTAVEVPASVAALVSPDADADYLFACILDHSPIAIEQSSRFARFMGVLRNKKKYEQFTDVSPTKQAFRYLFGKD